MVKGVKIVRTTPKSNVPVLVTQGWYDGVDNDVIYTFRNKTYGIFAPFEGVFLLHINETIPTQSHLERQRTIKISNIYGNAVALYRGDTVVSVGNLDAGCYLCHFDTEERKLYLVQ